MKTLSIKQPWASLIAYGIKNIENRTWRTHFRGRIYIHACAKPAKGISLLNNEQLKSLPDFEIETQLSAIIGEVEIIDCVINHESIWAEKTVILGETIDNKILYDEKPIYNWVLANPVLYDKPILNVKVKLSFWELGFLICPKCKGRNIVCWQPHHNECRDCGCGMVTRN